MKTIKIKENQEVRKGIIFLVFAVLCSLNLSAQTTFTIGSLKYTTTSNSTVSVSKKGTTPNFVVIPESVEYGGKQYSVTSIGDSAFYYCLNLYSVTIPNSVTTIGNYAFERCRDLESINIPNSVTTIGDYAFARCSEELKTINIPNSVTNIGIGAFRSCYALTSIDIPNSVTSIGESVFYDCAGLTSVTIPNSVTSIGRTAFYWCRKLTSVSIPNSVTSIAGSAFYWCTGLTGINVDENNTAYSSIDGVLFNKSQTELILCPEGKQGAYTIPNSVASIGNKAFSECTGLTSVTILNSVTNIGDDAFAGCTGLTSVTINSNTIMSQNYSSTSNMSRIFGKQVQTYIIGDSVTSIGNYTFFGCTGLNSLTIGNSVTSIGDYVFSYCSNLTEINVDENNATYSSNNGVVFNKSQTELVLYPVGKQGAYTVPNSVTSIGRRAFYECTGLTSIEIPNSVTSIGESAFAYCTGLTSVTIPNSVTSIGQWAFYGCTGLTSVDIPNSEASIGNKAFYGCTGLTSVTIPNSVTNIGDDAFAGCTGLTSVTINSNTIMSQNYSSTSNMSRIFGKQVQTYIIGDSVTSIGRAAFYDCTGLTSIEIPNSVTSIGRAAFYDCTGLTSIEIPNSVTNIGEYAFSNCSKLTSIDIPNSVTSIDQWAFNGCTDLTEINVDENNTVYSSIDGVLFNKSQTELVQYPGGKQGAYTIPSSVTSIERGAFYGCTGLTSVEIPNSVTSIGGSAFNSCTGLTSVTIPNSVTSIGKYAFENCTGLTDIYCHIDNPLTIDRYTFKNVPTNTCTLHVPLGSKEKYKAAKYWKDFLNIVEDLPTGIVSIENSQLTIDNGVWHTLNGTRLNGKPTKAGVYIVNGKKVVIK